MVHASAAATEHDDWTSPDYFDEAPSKEQRFIPLFMRQLLPGVHHRTRLTLTGWFLIVVAMGIGSAAYNTASNILFMTLSLVLSSLILSGILSTINFRKLLWTVHGPDHLRVGELGMATVRLCSEKRILPTMNLCFLLEHPGGKQVDRIYQRRALAPGATAELECAFVPQVRGLSQIKLMGAESEFPFGFLNKLLSIEQTHQLMVWPASISYTFIRQGGGQRFLSGESKRRVGMGTDLLNIRPYVPGDPPRLLHWKATARLGKPMTRQLAQEGERGYWIEVDVSDSRWSAPGFEHYCSIVCELALDLYKGGRIEGMWFSDTGFRAVRSLGDLHECFDRVAVLTSGAKVPLKRPRRPERGSCIHFEPEGENGVAIWIDDIRAGQTEL